MCEVYYCQHDHTVPHDYSVQADATAYFGSVQTNATFGSQIFCFRIIIDLSDFNNDLDFIVLIMVQGNLVERIFKFSDGTNQRAFQIAANGGIDAVNASRVFPEIRLIEAMMNRFVVLEEYVIYQAVPPSELELPATLNFDLNLIVLGQNPSLLSEQLPFAVGTVTLIPPTGTNDRTFNCSCSPAYSGDQCETLVDPCALEPCQNNGTCTNIGSGNYTCECRNQFTGTDCETITDHCALPTTNCNNGSCVDGIGTFTCECNPGFTGDFCDQDINECETAGCVNLSLIHI